MFKKGDYVICGSNGICKVTDVTTLNMVDAPKDRLYYIFKPVYSESSTVYIPVDNHKIPLRAALSEQEAHALIGKIPSLELLWVENEKQRELIYKECMKKNTCEDYVRIIKTLYLRRQSRLSKGKKVIGIDEKYLKMAEDYLYGELAVALGIEKQGVESYIKEEIGKSRETCY
ncbi:MAG: CarD family transcriptional regulator [Lachnospiraceae bacterium]|nr:CarD family transcriptional regulator [Lachnospiraceae bacterium]